MSDFFGLVKFIFAVSMVGTIAFLVLIALPKSKLRGVFLIVSSWIMKLLALLCLVYVVSPLDLLPDAIPVAGYADDLIASLIGTAAAIGGVSSSRIANREDRRMIDAKYIVIPEKQLDDNS